MFVLLDAESAHLVFSFVSSIKESVFSTADVHLSDCDCLGAFRKMSKPILGFIIAI
jgi:hypothetical protein